MNPNVKQQIERLWELQRVASDAVHANADYMATLVTAGIILTQNRWDQLFASWEQANKRMQEIGEALNKLHGL